MSYMEELCYAIDEAFGKSDPPYGLIDRIAARVVVWQCEPHFPCCYHCPDSHRTLFAGMGHPDPCRDLNCTGSDHINKDGEKL